MKQLPHSGLSAGASFWIVVGEPNDFWPSYLDWSLNFQFSKWRARSEPDLAPELKAILLEEEMVPIQVPKTNPRQCLVAAKHLLPCDYVNFFSCSISDTQAWLPQAAQIWRGLDKPSLRIFAGPESQKNKSLWTEVPRFFEGTDVNIVTQQALAPSQE
ncbi:MAG: hypothetical protein K2X47_03505 [Bdellovibrionales bacterium]|nr:hypothetical protein [Bdellovibrionales bacterium]